MVVQHNLTAMNANRMLGISQGTLSKSAEKLSSGYKVNRAADDAAGLSISEKMRKQMRGLTQASTNAADGISAVQTAEGALTEVHDMLQRMNELAVKASNGTNSDSDRQSIQDEIDQLVTEIDRVAETTKFNEAYLLKGDVEGNTFDMKVNAHDAGIKGKLVDEGGYATFTVGSELELGDKISIAGKEYTIGNDTADASVSYVKLGGVNTKTVSTGDSIADENTGVTYTLVDKVQNAGGLYVAGKTEFTITHEDGSEIHLGIGTGTGLVSATDAEELVKNELAAGSKITMTADDQGKACNYEIVDALQSSGSEREISSKGITTVTQFAGTNGANITLAAKDTVTIGGKAYEMTAETPKSAEDVTELISSLEKSDTVTITRDGGTAQTYTVSEKTDAVNNKYTVADLADLVQHGDKISFNVQATNTNGTNVAAAKGIVNATDYTVVGNGKSEDDDVISKAKALDMIAEELQKASSIGTDVAAEVKNNNDGTFTIKKGTVEVMKSLNFSLHVGADADMTNKINVDMEAMSAAGLGVKGISIKDKTGAAATYAIDSIADAVAKVSAQRSRLGAIQNRLEHTIKNLDNVVENTTAAESGIRDTDMALEMVKYSNTNILTQAGQSMLAQANQANQGVLSLLG